jgi:aminoglycoside phosphotransferase (APT) family kinase protein
VPGADLRLGRYLEAVRKACRDSLSSIDDPQKRRAVEQACVVLDRLIVEAGVLTQLKATAAIAYRDLLSHDHLLSGEAVAACEQPIELEFEQTRTRVQQLLRESSDASGEFLRKVISIEGGYLSGFEQAVKEASAQGGQQKRVDGAVEGAAHNEAHLSPYLSSVFGTEVQVVKLETMALGYSKTTLLARLQGTSGVPKVVVLRMDRDFDYLGTTVADEFPILRELHNWGIRVPRPYALEPSGVVLGRPFVVVDHVGGRNVGSHFSFPAPNRPLCRILARRLAEIHSVPIVEFEGKLRGAEQTSREQVESDVDNLYKTWVGLGFVAPTIEAAFVWLKRNTSHAVGRRTLQHGDFSLSNLLINEQGEVAAILDWEFARLGHPAEDLGWFYMAATRLADWQYFLGAYQEAGGSWESARQLDYFLVWGALRLAVISSQVECGFETGRSEDIRDAYAGSAFLRETILRVNARLSDLL